MESASLRRASALRLEVERTACFRFFFALGASSFPDACRLLAAALGLLTLAASPLEAASPDTILDLLDSITPGTPVSTLLSQHPSMRPLDSMSSGTTIYAMPVDGPYFSDLNVFITSDSISHVNVYYSTGLVAVNSQNVLDVVRWAPAYVASMRSRYGNPVSSGTWSHSEGVLRGYSSRELPDHAFITWKTGARFTTASFASPSSLLRGARLAVDQHATFSIGVTTTGPGADLAAPARVQPFRPADLEVSTRALADSIVVRPAPETAPLFPPALKGLYLGLPLEALVGLRPTQKDDFLWSRDSPLEDWVDDPLFAAAEHRTRAGALAATTLKAESVSALARWCAEHWGLPSALYSHAGSPSDIVPTEASIFLWDFRDARTALRWGRQKGAYGWYRVAEVVIFDRSIALENAVESAEPLVERTRSSREVRAAWNELLGPPKSTPVVRVAQMAVSSGASRVPPPRSEKDFAPDVPRVSVWMSVSASTPSTVIHAWYRDDVLVEEIPLQVGAGSSWHLSRKSALGPGRWHVVAREASGPEVGRAEFNISHAEAGGCRLSLKQSETTALSDGYSWSKGSLRCPPSIWQVATRLTPEGHAGWWTRAGGASKYSASPIDVLVRLPRSKRACLGSFRAVTEARRVSGSSSRMIDASTSTLRLASDFSLSVASWSVASDEIVVSLRLIYNPQRWPLGGAHLSFDLREPREQIPILSRNERWVGETLQDGESFHVTALDLRLPTLSVGRLSAVLTELRPEKLVFAIDSRNLR